MVYFWPSQRNSETRLFFFFSFFIFVKQGLSATTSYPTILNFFLLENLLALETSLDRYILLLKHKYTLGQPSSLIKRNTFPLKLETDLMLSVSGDRYRGLLIGLYYIDRLSGVKTQEETGRQI